MILKNMFKNKKVGIWGMGIVGKSALTYVQQYTPHIQILDIKKHDLPNSIVQTPDTTSAFLQHNDYIIASPGIPLHKYKQYHHKFITELDIYQATYTGISIAITGTLGKTTITSFVQQCTPHSIAAGNIGDAMLNIIRMQPQPSKVILELSSFQLHYAKNFKPQIAVLTNFYPNHLDHHKSEQEYFKAKCNIFKHQDHHSIALLPCNLLQKVQKTVELKSQILLFCSHQTCTSGNHQKHKTFFIKNNDIVCSKNQSPIFKDITQLPNITFAENWLIIAAILHLQNIPTANMLQLKPQPQEHRVEPVGTIKEAIFYNDSKSTVWQATLQALHNFNGQSCILFLGGLSKGADRTPLIQQLQHKNVTVIAFGKEAELIKKICDQFDIPCTNHQTLESAFEYCVTICNQVLHVLFSPAGSSFDLFKNYIERGNTFKKLVSKKINTIT